MECKSLISFAAGSLVGLAVAYAFKRATVGGTQEAKPALRVTITGAAGQIGSTLSHYIAQGQMFGPGQKVILQLLDLPFAEKGLKGLELELQDGAYELLEEVITTVDQKEGFKDADFAILVGAKPRGPNQQRADLLL